MIVGGTESGAGIRWGFALLAAAVLAPNLFSATVSSPTPYGFKSITLRYSQDSVVISDGDRFQTVELPEATHSFGLPGDPELPALQTRIVIPPDADVVHVVHELQESLISSDILLRPAALPVPTDVRPPSPTPNAARYASDAMFPTDPVRWDGTTHRIRGRQAVTLEITPVRYRPARREVYLATELRITVLYRLPDTAATLAAPATQLASPLFGAHLRGLVANPEDVTTLAAPREGYIALAADDTCEYLIITSEALAPAFAALADHRRAFNGYRCAIETIADIANRYDGTRPDGGSDLQTQIRNCIRDYVNNRGAVYAVLGGDDTIVPDRDCYVAAGSFIERDMPTDAYYAGLDGTWDDADQDGVYGEHGVGGINEYDLDADIFVGRIPVRTAEEAANYIAKVTAYETNPPEDILHKFMMGGKLLWASYTGDRRPTETLDDGHRAFRDDRHPQVSDVERLLRLSYRDNVQAYGWSASQVGCMFDTLTSWDGSADAGTYAADADNMQTRFSEGWNFLFHDTHGNTGLWNGESTGLACEHAAALTGLTCFTYTIACDSGAFDRETSLGEAFLRNGGGGALAYMGCSRYGWSGISPAFRDAFQTVLFRDRTATIGPAFYAHKASIESSYAYRRWVHFGLNLQGDPALRIQGLEPDVTLTANDAWASETDSDNATVTLTRTSTGGELAVALEFSGSAAAADYAITPAPAVDGTITFHHGETAIALTITPIDDTQPETNETLNIRLSPSLNYAVHGDSEVAVVIVDNDNADAHTVTIAATDPNASELDEDPGTFLITRSGGDLPAITARYTVSGSAGGSDYAETFTGQFIFEQGVVSHQLSLTPVDDTYPEGHETVTLTLSASENYSRSIAEATVTIADDESPAIIALVASDPVAREGADGEAGAFSISRTGGVGLPLEVYYMLEVSGTASEVDFNIAQFRGTALLPAGATSVELPVIPVDDARLEATETVILRLTGTGGFAEISDAYLAIVEIFDDDNLPPSITVATDCGDTAECGDQITITAYPQDPEDAIAWVEILWNDTVIASAELPPYTVTLTVPPAGEHEIRARAWDSGSAGAVSEPLLLTVSAIPDGSGSGITHDWWTGVAGNDVGDLTAYAAYPDSPSGSTTLTNAFETQTDWQNSYGSRVTGYFIAPKDGTYRFTLVADDRGELWLGTSGSPDSGQRIAYVNSPTGPRDWNLYATQTADPITLAAGQAYFIEALHKDGTGGDCLAVGVELPGGQLERPIPAHRLMPWKRDASVIAISAPDQMTVAESGQSATYGVALTAQPTSPADVILSSTASQLVFSPNVLHFTLENWWNQQEVTVTAIDDDSIEADPHHVMVSHTVSGGGNAFDGATSDISIAIRDNDFELVKWPYKARFTFDGYTGSAPLVDFPVLVTLSTNIPAFDYAQFGSGNGSDLRFVTPEGEALSYEIETWDPAGESHVWVRIPELTPSDTTIWAYWGNLVRTNLPAASIDGSLWSSSYEAVWHMAGEATHDATTRGNDLSFNGVRHGDAGIVGTAVGLDGEDAIRSIDRFAWDGGDFTVSAWVQHLANDDAPQSVFTYGTPSTGTRLLLGFADRQTMTFGFPNRTLITAPAPLDNDWHHWAGVYSEAGGSLSVFRDGVLVANGNTSASNLPLAEATLRLGEDFGDARLSGTLDEIRFAATTRSEEWIRAAYTTAATPSQFYSCSSVDIAYPVLDEATHITDITPNAATIHSALLSTGAAPARVSVFIVDGTTAPASDGWDQEIDLGYVDEGSLQVNLTGLNFGTEYRYCFYAENEIGGIWSDTIGSFATPMDPPRCDTLPASGVSDTSSRLNGFVEYTGSGSDLPTVTVFWGTTDAGTNAAQWQLSRDLGAIGIGAFATIVADLDPGTRYIYRARVSSTSGTSWSSTPRVLVTRTKAPSISDSGLVTASASTAVLSATLDDAGGDTPTITLFWGDVDGGSDPANWQHGVTLGTRNQGDTITGTIDGLTPDTEYFYRWRAVNSGGAAWSAAEATIVTLFDRSRMDGMMHITFPGYTRSTTLTDFPVAITLSESIPNFSYASFASDDGHDIRFTNADGTQALQYEIENWNTNGESTVWVKIPSLTPDTSIYVYWGDPDQMSQHRFTTNGAVWRADYHGVWHFNTGDDANVHRDSSPNARHDTAPSPTSAAGQIALAEDFSDTPDSAICLEAAPCDVLLPASNALITASCWFRADTISDTLMGGMLIHLSAAGGWNPILLSVGSRDQLQLFHSGRNTGGDIGLMLSDTSIAADSWNHAAVVFNGTHFLLYLNGEEVARQAGTLDAGTEAGAWVGSLGGSASFFDGTIDELRFSSTARSADWIWAAARSQDDSTAFVRCSPVLISVPDSDGDGILDDIDPDDDNDGMPDVWETAYGLRRTVPADALEDRDGDGMRNGDEFIAGTDPTRGESALRLQSARGPKGCELSFLSATGRVYTIETCTDIGAGNWTPVGNDIAGTGSNIAITDSTPGRCRFYRIRATLEP
jgi:hypothetical protein